MAKEPSTLSSQPGEHVGKYEILKHIANGGMGEVYRALDTESQEEVALKILSQEMSTKPAMIERFRREARSASKLNHENIVRVYEFGESEGKMYIAMEFVEGIDLHEHIDQKGKLDPEESRQIMIQAARALAHAASHGIVHRDIKPSNFLLARKNNRLVVKLTDMGLAREQDNDQFRVTRAGTTVGTVDYISPEQARDSGGADERSDLYSLGCTWFHMLAGQPPFAKGGLAERLVKHMETPPPDIRKFNPRVSDALIEVLSKLLAKKPADRYQTAQDLVQALQELNPTRSKAAPRSDTVPDLPGKGRQRPGSDTPRKKKGRSTNVDQPKGNKSARSWLIAGALVTLLVLGGATAYLLTPPANPTPPVEDPNQQTRVDPIKVSPRDDGPVNKDGSPARDGNPGGIKPPDPMPPVPVPVPPKFASLYKPSSPIPVDKLAQDFRTPWSQNESPPADAVVARVSRAPDGLPGWHSSLSEAVAKTPADRPLVIEIHDHGPFPVTSVLVRGRSLVLRPGKGYQPLLLWDIPLTVKDNPSTGALAFLTVEKGHLWVENLEIVVSWPVSQPVRDDAFFRVTDGDVSLREVTVSLGGKHDSMTLCALRSKGRSRGRLERVYARGDGLAVLALDAGQAEVGFDGCLFVGGKKPLLQVVSSESHDLRLWASQSTFVAQSTLLEVASPPKQTPSLKTHWWDCLLTRSGAELTGELLRLPPDVKLDRLAWQSTNCLVSGWPTLLSGGERATSSANVNDWLVLWNRTEGEVVRPNPWPAPTIRETENKPALTYNTQETPLCFASTRDPMQPLGVRLDRLPSARDTWQIYTTDRYLLPVINPLEDVPPQIPVGGDGLYHGEVLDLSVTPDVGFHLARQRKWGPRVVLHLKGVGEKPTSPIRVPAGSTLVLHAEPPPANEPPLTLRFVLQAGVDVPALVSTEGGGLELFNLELKPAEGTFVRNPPHLLSIKGGPLKLYRCKLITPPTPIAGLKGLITMQGGGLSEREKGHPCLLTECVLISGNSGLHVGGTGVLVALQGTLCLTTGPALEFEPGTVTTPALGLTCILENSTLCSQSAIIAVAPPSLTQPNCQPLAIQSRNCLFLNPFAQGSGSALLHARGSTLAAGWILWQSDEDHIDARIPRAVVVGEDNPKAPVLSLAEAWGSGAHRKGGTLTGLKTTLDANTWSPLDPLLLPLRFPGLGNRKPGADLVEIGAIKRKRP